MSRLVLKTLWEINFKLHIEPNYEELRMGGS